MSIRNIAFFEIADEATDTKGTSERLQKFLKAVWKALVPTKEDCLSVQGKMVRGNSRLLAECLRNGMCNYYVPDETIAQKLLRENGAVDSRHADDQHEFCSERSGRRVLR